MVHLVWTQTRRIWWLHLVTNVSFGAHSVTVQRNPLFGKFLPDYTVSYLISGFAPCYTLPLDTFTFHFFFVPLCWIKWQEKIIFLQHNQLRWRRFIFLLPQNFVFFVLLFSLPIKIFCTCFRSSLSQFSDNRPIAFRQMFSGLQHCMQ
jgi:hypothetical protein